MSERSKERRRLAQQQLRARREQAEQQLHEKHEAAEQASKLHMLQQLLHQTLLSDTTATRQAFEQAVKDMDITNAYLVHLNTTKHDYSGIAASILHQRKYVDKSYDGDITYKGPYAGAFTTWDNVTSANLHIDGDFALMHATVKGVNVFNKARFTGNNILFSAKIECEDFGHRSVVHGHGFCAHTEVNVKDGCMVNSKVVGSNCFESSRIEGPELFHGITIKGDYFAKKASLVGKWVFSWCRVKGDHNLWNCTIKTGSGFGSANVTGNAFANYSQIKASECLFKRSKIYGLDFAHKSNLEAKEIHGDNDEGFIEECHVYPHQKIMFNGKEELLNDHIGGFGLEVGILTLIMSFLFSILAWWGITEFIAELALKSSLKGVPIPPWQDAVNPFVGGIAFGVPLSLFLLALFFMATALHAKLRSRSATRNYKRKQF